MRSEVQPRKSALAVWNWLFGKQTLGGEGCFPDAIPPQALKVPGPLAPNRRKDWTADVGAESRPPVGSRETGES